MAQLLKKGSKIHIKKSHEGRFTEYCGGVVSDECIQRGKKSPDPKIRKQAVFAQNARKFKHQQGGVVGQYGYPYGPMPGFQTTMPWPNQYGFQSTYQMPYQPMTQGGNIQPNPWAPNNMYGQTQINTNTNFAQDYQQNLNMQTNNFMTQKNIQEKQNEIERQAKVQHAQGVGAAVGNAVGELGKFAYNKIQAYKEKKNAGEAGAINDGSTIPTSTTMKDGGALEKIKKIRMSKYGSKFYDDGFVEYEVVNPDDDETETTDSGKTSRYKPVVEDLVGMQYPIEQNNTEEPNKSEKKEDNDWFKHDQDVQPEDEDDDNIATGQFDLDFKRYGKSPIFTNHKKFWRNLVKSESGFRPYVRNKEGAYGYFQLMPASRTGESIQTQFEDARKLMISHMSMLNQDDKRLARQQGITEEGLMAGVWLGGPVGVKRALRGKGNAKDSNGTSVMGYMKKFSNL